MSRESVKKNKESGLDVWFLLYTDRKEQKNALHSQIECRAFRAHDYNSGANKETRDPQIDLIHGYDLIHALSISRDF